MLEKITMEIETHESQTDLFTPYHRKYKVVIKYNGKQYTTTYQCNAKHNPKESDIIYCLLLDTSSYDNANDIKDFAEEFGYELYNDYGNKYNKETEKIYKACKKTSEAMHKMFTDSEMEMLYKEVDN